MDAASWSLGGLVSRCACAGYPGRCGLVFGWLGLRDFEHNALCGRLRHGYGGVCVGLDGDGPGCAIDGKDHGTGTGAAMRAMAASAARAALPRGRGDWPVFGGPVLAITSAVKASLGPIAAWPDELRDAPPATPIIVVGGSFDPPHRAHVELPRRVRDATVPGAELLFVPAAASPFKQGQPATAAGDRQAMLRLAIEGVPRAGVWTDEIDRGSTASYTIDTLQRLHSLRPLASLLLLIGADQAAAFHKWRDPRGILLLARVLVIRREPFSTKSALLDELRRLAFWSDAETTRWSENIIEVPLDGVSATNIRQEIGARGVGSVASMLAPAVREYIRRRHLYESLTE